MLEKEAETREKHFEQKEVHPAIHVDVLYMTGTGSKR